MQPTDLNAHAAPWQGPRPTTSPSASRDGGPGASKGSAADARPGFVLHGNVTNAHAAEGRPQFSAAAAPFAAPRSAAGRHPWWGPVQPHVAARPHWARRPQPQAPARSPTPPAQANVAVSPGTTFATPPSATAAGASRIETLPPPMVTGSRRPSDAAGPRPTPAAAPSVAPPSSSLIFDGRLHRQSKPHGTPATQPHVSAERSQSSSSETSAKSPQTKSDTPAPEAKAGPLLGTESLLFDPSSIVRPSVTPAVFASGPVTLLNTPPVTGQEMMVTLPSPMPSTTDDTRTRVLIDVEDLLDGINWRTPDA